MAIDLKKGGRINLQKEAPALTKVSIGLGWKPNAFNTGTKFDLDASVFLLDANEKLISDAHFIFYNQPDDPQRAVHHSGDNRDGTADIAFGDGIEVDEVITIELAKLDPRVEQLSFIVTIDDADTRKQNFGQVTKSIIALRDDSNMNVLAKYPLEDDFSSETAVQFGSLVKKDGAWVFKAVGAGFNKGLADFVVVYGGNLA
jgi:tellurium resistance protein TerD